MAGTLRVVVADQVADDLAVETAALEPIGAELVVSPSPDEDALVAAVADADAVLVTYAKVSARVIEAAERCRIVARYGIGYDNVDVEAASRAGMFVTNVPDYCLEEVADHTLALLLGVARGVVAASARVRDGHWDGGTGEIHRLRGRRLALAGVGGIGRRVALRARAFGLEVVGYDPYLEEWNVEGAERAASLEEAVAEADFVSLHMPLTQDSRHIVDAELIASMRRAPVLINTARGPLVDHDALAAALAEGAISGAALDVTEPEPLPVDHPLRRDPRAVITAHMAFYSVEAGEELRRRAAEEVGRVLRGIAPEHAINREAIDAARVSEQSGERAVPRYPDLAGKVAAVTGGSRGIGAATCRMLVANGVAVAVNGRSREPLDAIVAELRAAGGSAAGFAGDCGSAADMEGFRDFVVSELGPPDILLAFAGGFESFTPIEHVSEPEWREVLDANLTSLYLTIRAFLPGFLERRAGVIVTMASNGGRYLDKLLTAPYAAAKAGVVQLTRHLALELGPRGIRVNCIAPATVTSERVRAIMDEEALARTAAMSPLGRMGTPEDCALATLFLVSDSAAWLTGNTLDVAGGRIML